MTFLCSARTARYLVLSSWCRRSIFLCGEFMKRREFLARSAFSVSATLLLGSVRSDGYRFVGSPLPLAREIDRK